MNTNDTEIERIKNDFNAQEYCQFLGINIVNLKKGIAQLSLCFNKNILNREETVHAGIITSLADSAAAVAVLSTMGSGGRISTIELKINFLHPVKNSDLFAEAKIIHKGSRTAVGDVEIKTKEDRLVAKCLLTFMILEERKKENFL
jgi:acyl-CoA thioesterase